METSRADRLEQAVARLNDIIALVRDCGLEESEMFLSMAKMHLQLDINGITELEFRELCLALEGKRSTPTARARPGQARNRRDADMKLMQRAWHCRDGAAPRGGRSRAKR
jgi:hypothetical protein